MWLINLLKKRPKDSTIRAIKIFLWLAFSWSLYYYLIYSWKSIDSNYFWFINISENNLIYLKYFFIALWLLPFIVWFFNLCFIKSKYMRIVQIIMWFVIFYISFKIEESPTLWIPELVFLLGFIPLLWWITWKCITSKCLRFWQKIEKIRV